MRTHNLTNIKKYQNMNTQLLILIYAPLSNHLVKMKRKMETEEDDTQTKTTKEDNNEWLFFKCVGQMDAYYNGNLDTYLQEENEPLIIENIL